jgi:hypothetical protein
LHTLYGLVLWWCLCVVDTDSPILNHHRAEFTVG